MISDPAPPSQEPEEEREPRSAAKPNGWTETAIVLARVSGLGWFMAASIALGAFGGNWLDRQFGLSPILTVVGIAFGAVVAVWGMIRVLRSINRDGSSGQ